MMTRRAALINWYISYIEEDTIRYLNNKDIAQSLYTPAQNKNSKILVSLS